MTSSDLFMMLLEPVKVLFTTGDTTTNLFQLTFLAVSVTGFACFIIKSFLQGGKL